MAAEKLCTNCHFIGKPRKITKGSLLIEILLWIMFIFPGLIYSIWRLTSKISACPQCQAPNMIPLESQMAQRILAPPKIKKAPAVIKEPDDDAPNVYVIDP